MRHYGEVLVPRPKYQKIVSKRPYGPGVHGQEKTFTRRAKSDYSIQLDEKQKLKFIYSVRERALRNYFIKAERMTGRTGSNLLALLERRLDSVVYRAGLAATIWAARQMVNHGHILADGRRVDIASFLVAPGQVITLHEKMRRNVQVSQWMKEQGGHSPRYLAVEPDQFKATLLSIPERDDIPVPVNEQLVVEFYNRKV